MADILSNGFHSMMHSIWEILDKVDLESQTLTLTCYKLGKLIKRHNVKSKHTLEDDEISYYSKMLFEIFKNWGMFGHPDWKVKEKVPSGSFTVQFRRKTEEDYQKKRGAGY